MWSKLAEYGKKGAFKTDKTFSELAELMLQIKEIQEQKQKSITIFWTSSSFL